MSEQEFIALEIDRPEIATIITALDPTLLELDYEKDLQGKFIVAGYPEPGKYALVNIESFYKDGFLHIQNSDRITLRIFAKE